jgi:transposase
MSKRPRYPHELRERALRLVREHRRGYPSEWAAITSIAGKVGVGTEALRLWLRWAEFDQHQGPGVDTVGRVRIRDWSERIGRRLRLSHALPYRGPMLQAVIKLVSSH